MCFGNPEEQQIQNGQSGESSLSFPRKLGGVMRGPKFLNVSQESKEKIHNAALEILERVGARLFFPDAVALLAKAGATVTEGNLVRVAANLVERALSTVPKTVDLYDRNGDLVMPLDGSRSYYGPGSDCLNGAILKVRNGPAMLDALASHHYILFTGHVCNNLRLIAPIFDFAVKAL